MKLILLAASASLALATAAAAQQPPPGGPPPGPRPAPQVTKNPTAAVAGNYALDKNHQSVIVRIPHGGGMSFIVFRFAKAEAMLQWDPANPGASSLTATVEPASITTPVANFADELAGPKFLKTADFPKATFVSTSAKATGPTTGVVSGNLTFMGKTAPMSFNTELVGAGKSMMGVSTLGFHAVGKLKPAEFGLMMGPPTMEVEITFDGEFNKK